jgi:hypothetical protein
VIGVVLLGSWFKLVVSKVPGVDHEMTTVIGHYVVIFLLGGLHIAAFSLYVFVLSIRDYTWIIFVAVLVVDVLMLIVMDCCLGENLARKAVLSLASFVLGNFYSKSNSEERVQERRDSEEVEIRVYKEEKGEEKTFDRT